MKSKSNQIYLKEKIIQDVMSIHYQKFNCKKIICVIQFWGSLMCFHPSGSSFITRIFHLEVFGLAKCSVNCSSKVDDDLHKLNVSISFVHV
jgi:hypothetical protein